MVDLVMLIFLAVKSTGTCGESGADGTKAFGIIAGHARPGGEL